MTRTHQNRHLFEVAAVILALSLRSIGAQPERPSIVLGLDEEEFITDKFELAVPKDAVPYYPYDDASESPFAEPSGGILDANETEVRVSIQRISILFFISMFLD